MRKLTVLLMICCILFTGCQSVENPSDDTAVSDTTSKADTTAAQSGSSHGDIPANVLSNDVIEITEKLFIAQTNDIYLNQNDYMGKTIKYEGIFNHFLDPTDGNTYYYVIRYGPGCCGTDGDAGFEVFWENGEYPDEDEWVEVVGVLEQYDDNGATYLRLNLSSLTVLNERGEEYVS